MMRAGAIVLTVWSGLNLAVAFGAVVAMVVFGQHAPGLALYAGAAARTVDARVLGVVDALGIIGNGCIAALCVLVLAVVWRGLYRGARWTLPALAVTLGPLQALAFASDARLGHPDLAVNLVSTALLGGGLLLAARAPRISEGQN